MTKRFEEIVASIDRGDAWDHTTVDLVREVQRLRSLPMIATCSACAGYGRAEADDGHGPCYHEAAAIQTTEGLRPAATMGNEAPHAWCPLRQLRTGADEIERER